MLYGPRASGDLDESRVFRTIHLVDGNTVD